MSFLEEFSHLRIPLEDIIQATNNFSCENLMGENCYGKMYKGKFLRPDGFVTFTFEQLKKAPDESGPRKFSQDIKFSGFKHDNILSLVGFCDEQDETILVHEFATHGSLDRYLRSANLTWLKRLQICLDAARGLEYLHDPGKTQIKVVLGNVGSANIQLDQNWHAKIANFSSSRYLQQTEQVSEYGYSTTSTQLTYMDTTSTEKDIITTATDTYCFGLVLMEVLCGRQAYEEYQPSLGPEACEHYKEGKLTEIIDPNLRKQMSVDSLDLFSAIAYQCLKNNQEPPRMFEVVEKLEEVLEYQLQFEQALALLQEEFAHLRIPLEHITQATKNFADENVIVSDYDGKMYKGELLQHGGRVTATFKQVDNKFDQGSLEILKEILPLFEYRHENIDFPIGFCDEGNKIILVHEFQTHGNLSKHLSSANLTWLKRLKICLDAARGLNYLHNPPGIQTRALHRDLTSANILLDGNWHGKLANLCLSNYHHKNDKHIFLNTNVTATLAYMDPAYTETGILTKKSDIYSFGVILMETLCARLPHVKGMSSLGTMACFYYKEGKLTDIVYPFLRKQMSADSLDVFLTIAYKCLKNNRMERPTVFEVVKELEEAVELQQKFEEVSAVPQEDFDYLRIPMENITQATNNFAYENFIVGDDYGKMYKGELLQPRGRVMATFKQFDNTLGQGSQKFLKEIMPLFGYRHENIDFPIGFCDEGNKIILVHEVQTNGSLSRHLSSANLTWLKRLQICLDAARGLNYLHNTSRIQTRAFHRDLKSANILLDGNWHAKLANLCLSNYLQKNDEPTFLDANDAATLAYMDPAYSETGILTIKSDIYSFGIVLMEALCGRLAHVEGKPSLGPMACLYYEEGKLSEIIHPFLRKQMSVDSLDVFSAIAYKCLKNNQMERPGILEVVKELQEVLGLQKKFEEASAHQQDEFAHLRISFEDITEATNNFADENVIVSDDYGKMYKGELLRLGVRVTATFKQVDSKLGQGSLEILKETLPLFKYRHENIDFPIGFCDEGNKIILVHEVQTNGSLSRHLSSANLTWLKRLQICLGAARGLNYLHNTSRIRTRALHCDLKSANIMLKGNWNAKLANLWLSNSLQKNDDLTFVDTNDAATLAYMDPAYSETGILTIKSDIYSFGIVLVEVLCGRLADAEGKPSLGPMACLYYEEGKLSEIIHPFLRKQMSADSLDVFSAIAYKCLKNNQMERPGILEVVKELQEVLGLQKKFEEASAHQQVKTMEYMKIPLKDIKSATHDFHEHFKIGRGGFGDVYKADLFHFDFRKYVIDNRVQRLTSAELSNYPRRRSTVAIKRLDRRYGQGTAEFLQELSVLPYFKHKNVVTLVGFCDEDRECILVYEYASNGSLQDHIQSANTTHSHTWARRLQICLDAAYGLEFLHNGLGEHYRIIHRDIKSSNILLGQNYIGMISDFGLSKIGPANREATCVMTQVAGTPLYIDPEYQKTNMLTKESDVYSFGVVLFEALSGRLVHSGSSKDDPEFVLKMAKRCFEQRNVKEIIHSNFKTEFEKAGSSIQDDETCPDSIHIFAAIAYKCCKDKREDRPTMVEVVKELEKALKSHVNRVEAFRITLGDIRSATNDFRDIIEQGPPGEVYCGELSYLKGRGTVTIKRLHPSVDSSGEEFVKEIARLYSYSHENVVPVLGFCEEGTERIIVLEHMVKGSLKDHLTNTSLMWKQRLKICIDAAYGLAYIHSHADQTEHMVHGDLKSSSILLGDDWKAAISDFIVFKGAGTLGYLDPLYATTSSLTQESEVYSFGVILFEILSGRLANERIEIDQQQPPLEVPNVELQLNTASCTCNDNEPVAFLANWASKCFKNKKIEDIIFHAIKKEIEPMSLVIFSTIANQCLMEQRTDRPTMTKVVEELEKALDCQDEWEWEQKLPTDYKEIIQMSKRPLASTIRKKDIHSLLSSGMLLHNEKWFSISMDGARNEMASAKTFSYGDVSSVKWKSVQKSRFPKVARIPDISNLNIKIKLKTQFLTPEMMYGAYLVFKFCDKRKVSSRPLYVNLKYKKAGETLSAYFAEWEVGTEWLKVKLFQFSSNNGSIDVEILLESLSQYYCGRGAIYIEGIKFQAIRSVDFEHNNELKDGTNSEGVLINTQLDMDWVEKMLYRYEKIIRRYGKNVHVANGIDNKEVIYRLLSEGIHIDKGEKFFSLSKAMKNCHMLRASSVIYNSLNLRFSTPPTGLRCRFAKVAKILSHQDFRIKCDIETQMLSSDATYACFLVFKLSKKCRGLKCPVKARDLVPHRKERTKIISFRYPSTVNLDKIKWIPEQREDGWMEVKVWEFNVDNTHNDEFVPMDLKLTCFEGNMSGFIVYGIEFRPIA